MYPQELPQREWFGWYSDRFDTVEINNTFYRLPNASTVEHWAQQAPPGFVYSVSSPTTHGGSRPAGPSCASTVPTP